MTRFFIYVVFHLFGVTLTLERHRAIRRVTGINLRVLVDSVDVSDRCIDANVLARLAWCFCVDVNGRKYMAPNRLEVAKEQLIGRVEVVA